MNDNQEKLNLQLLRVVYFSEEPLSVRLKKAKYLIYLGADVNTRDKSFKKSILAIAKDNGDVQMAKLLEDNGAVEVRIDEEKSLELGKQFWNSEHKLKSIEEIVG